MTLTEAHDFVEEILGKDKDLMLIDNLPVVFEILKVLNDKIKVLEDA